LSRPYLAAKIDRAIRRQAANRTRLDQRSFMQEILFAASAREVGATVITECGWFHADWSARRYRVCTALAPTPAAA
jgi:hypothetical protein